MLEDVYWRVGELAGRTGLTVRTLHYYDEIGLLSPSHRSEGGYRLYTAEDVALLQQIRSLRQLGFSLGQVRALLAQPKTSLPGILRAHSARLKQQIELEQLLRQRLEALVARLEDPQGPAAGVWDYISTMEVMTMVDKYYTPEQLAELRRRSEEYGAEHIKAVEAEWPQLIAEMRRYMEQGVDPADERVQALGRRWQELVHEFTGGNPGIEQALGRLYEQEEGLRQQTGLDPQLMAYVGKAQTAT